jgi:hypothetical protein
MAEIVKDLPSGWITVTIRNAQWANGATRVIDWHAANPTFRFARDLEEAGNGKWADIVKAAFIEGELSMIFLLVWLLEKRTWPDLTYEDVADTIGILDLDVKIWGGEDTAEDDTGEEAVDPTVGKTSVRSRAPASTRSPRTKPTPSKRTNGPTKSTSRSGSASKRGSGTT